MRKTYLKPITKIHVMNCRLPLLGDSVIREVGGGPTDEGGVPPAVGEVGEGTDPYGGGGQGSGGGGNRAKGFSAWDF